MESASRSELGWGYTGVAVGLGVLVSVGFILQWLQTRLLWVLVVGLLAGVAVSTCLWVFGDAKDRVPRVPWALVALFLPVLGLAFYLLAREVKAR